MVYDISGFLDKNKDTLFQDFKRLLYSSKDHNIRHMWPEGAQDIHKVNSNLLRLLRKNHIVPHGRVDFWLSSKFLIGN